MTTPQDPTAPRPAEATGDDQDEAAAVRQQIEQSREDLGDTLEELSARTDVKAQAAAKADELKQRARQVGDDVKRRPAPFVAGAIAVVLVLLLGRRRRRRARSTLGALTSLDTPVRAIVVSSPTAEAS